MNPKRTGQPAAPVLTLADAKAHLKVTFSDVNNDAYITTLVDVATRAAEDRLQRTLISTPWCLTLDTFPDAFRLMYPPILTAVAVRYRDVAGTEQTLDPADYQLDKVSEPGYLVPAPGRSWPVTEAGRVNAVAVDYTAGYGSSAAAVPAPIRHWILLALTDMYERRGRSAEKPAVPQHFAEGLLDTYLMWSV